MLSALIKSSLLDMLRLKVKLSNNIAESRSKDFLIGERYFEIYSYRLPFKPNKTNYQYYIFLRKNVSKHCFYMR